YYPFGGERVITDTLADQNYKFTGKERDPETNLDYFGARYYAFSMGRFLTPDWADKPTAVTYADFGNPQSLNLYSYVNNNPTTVADADGRGAGADDAVEAAIIGVTILVMATQAYYALPEDKRDFGAAIRGAYTDVKNTIQNWVQSEDKGNAPPSPPGSGSTTAETSSGVNSGAGQPTAPAGDEGPRLKPTPPGENAAAAAGRAAHKDFAAKVKAKPGWTSQPRLTDPKTGKGVEPDATTRSGRPVELKPRTPSGQAKGKTALKKQQRATGKKGRVIYY